MIKCVRSLLLVHQVRKVMIIVLEVFGFWFALGRFSTRCAGRATLFKTMHMSSTQMIVINISNCKTNVCAKKLHTKEDYVLEFLYYLRSVPLVHFNFLVEVFLAFYRNVIRIL